MADYTVSAGHKALGKWTLTAGSADTVAFEDNVQHVQVINDGASPDDVWAIADDSIALTVPGAHVSTPALRIPPGGVLDLEMRRQTDSVKLISAGAATVSIQVRDA